MIFETINDIKNAEAEADRLTAQALEEGKVSVQKAEEEAERIRKDVVAQVRQEREKVCEAAREDGLRQGKAIIAEGNVNARKIIETADVSATVNFIKEKVFATYGNH